MIGKGDFDFCAVRNERSRRLEPKERLFGQRFAGFAGMVGVIEPDSDDFRRTDGRERAQALQARRFSLKRRGPEDITLQTKQFAIHHLGIKYLVALLKSADCCHSSGAVTSK